MNNPNGARSAFENAIRSDEQNAGPYMDLVQIELQQERWNEASQLMDTLLGITPGDPKAHYFNGLAKFNLKQYPGAEASFRVLEQHGHCQEYPMSYFFLGMIDVDKGEIPAAAEEFRLFLQMMPSELLPPGWKENLSQQLRSWESQGLIEKSGS
jgi:TolA-binding protein